MLKEPWGQLVSAGDAEESEEERVPLLGERFLIGRNKGWAINYKKTHLSLYLSQMRSWRWQRTGSCPPDTVSWRETRREGSG